MFRLSFWIRLLVLPAVCLTVSCSRTPSENVEEGVEALGEGKPDRAYRAFRQAAEALDESPGAAPVWNGIGVAAAATGREEQAETAFRQAVALDGSLAAAYVNLGLLYRQQGKMEEADVLLRQAVEADPEDTFALEFRMVDAVRAGDAAAALDAVRQASGRREDERTLSALAVLSSNHLSVAERREFLQRAVSLNPTFAAAQVNLAALLDQHRLDPAQALAHYEAFVRLEPESPLIPQVVQRMQMMESRIASGDAARPDPVRVEVEEWLRRAAEAGDPRSALPLCLRAHAVAARASRTDLREQALRQAAELAPESARAHVGLGRVLREQGRFAEAWVSFDTANTLAPGWDPALTGAVEAAMAMGRVRDAREVLDETVDRPGLTAPALLRLAELYDEPLGATTRAREVYRRVSEEYPGTEEAARARERLEG